MRKRLLACLLLMVIAIIFTGPAPAQVQSAGMAKEASKSAASLNKNSVITVMNPAVANKLAERLPLSPRLDSLEGKTIYMVDIGWGGPEAAYSVFEEIQAWFSKNMPSVKTVIKIKRGGYEADDPALWQEMSEKKVDAAIIGVSA
jgi:hypothetical protein